MVDNNLAINEPANINDPVIWYWAINQTQINLSESIISRNWFDNIKFDDQQIIGLNSVVYTQQMCDNVTNQYLTKPHKYKHLEK